VLPVLSVDGHAIGGGAAGPLTKRIQAEYWRRRDEGWHGTDIDGLLGIRAR